MKFIATFAEKEDRVMQKTKSQILELNIFYK